jgi:hypothetical protein
MGNSTFLTLPMPPCWTTNVGCPKANGDEVSWQSAFWSLPPIALSVMLQPGGYPIDYELSKAVSMDDMFSRASPFVCAADSLNIILEFAAQWYACQNLNESARRGYKHRFEIRVSMPRGAPIASTFAVHNLLHEFLLLEILCTLAARKSRTPNTRRTAPARTTSIRWIQTFCRGIASPLTMSYIAAAIFCSVYSTICYKNRSDLGLGIIVAYVVFLVFLTSLPIKLAKWSLRQGWLKRYVLGEWS